MVKITRRGIKKYSLKILKVHPKAKKNPQKRVFMMRKKMFDYMPFEFYLHNSFVLRSVLDSFIYFYCVFYYSSKKNIDIVLSNYIEKGELIRRNFSIRKTSRKKE